MGRRSTTTCKLCGGPATDKHPTLALCDGHFVNYNREAGRRTYQRSRDRAFEVLGRACVRCGFADPRALQIDHVFPTVLSIGARLPATMRSIVP